MSTSVLVTTHQNPDGAGISDGGSRATLADNQNLSASDDRVTSLVRTYPGLDRLWRSARLVPGGYAAEYFRDLHASVAALDVDRIIHALASAGVL